MIGKQVKGKSFLGTLRYVLSKDEAQLISTNMLGRTPEELSREFGLSRKLRPRLKKCVYHASLSLPEGEKLTKKQWAKVTEKYLEGMNFWESQYVSVLHNDTQHQHIHIIASRVRMDGSVVSDSNDYQRSEKVIRRLEREFGLTRVPLSREVERRAPTSGELRKALREQKPSIKAQMQNLLDTVMVGQPNMSEFFSRLEQFNILAQANIAKTGHISGISYTLNGETMKGSDLGKRYTWQGLQVKGFVTYVKDRDFQSIIEKSKRNINRVSERNRVNRKGENIFYENLARRLENYEKGFFRDSSRDKERGESDFFGERADVQVRFQDRRAFKELLDFLRSEVDEENKLERLPDDNFNSGDFSFIFLDRLLGRWLLPEKLDSRDKTRTNEPTKIKKNTPNRSDDSGFDIDF